MFSKYSLINLPPPKNRSKIWLVCQKWNVNRKKSHIFILTSLIFKLQQEFLIFNDICVSLSLSKIELFILLIELNIYLSRYLTFHYLWTYLFIVNLKKIYYTTQSCSIEQLITLPKKPLKKVKCILKGIIKRSRLHQLTMFLKVLWHTRINFC